MKTQTKQVLILITVFILFPVLAFLLTNDFSPKTVHQTNVQAVEQAKVPQTQVVPPNDLTTLLNDYRAENGLGRLPVNPKLVETAQKKADELCTSGKWSHERPDGRAFETITEGILTYYRFGENLGMGFDTNEQVMQAWKDSPTHNKNMLEDYWLEVGIASNECGGKNYVVQHYMTY